MIRLFIFATLLALIHCENVQNSENPQIDSAPRFTDALINQPGCGFKKFAKRSLRDVLETNSTDKIANGIQTLRGDWPWQVSIRVNGRHICGGSLINERWVVTAAHCINPAQRPQAYQILAGAYDIGALDASVKITTAQKVINHPQYSRQTLRNDISLIKLAQPIPSNNDNIVPVCLKTTGEDLTSKPAVATGWGASFIGGAPQRIKMQAKQTVQQPLVCTRMFGATFQNQIHVCAGASHFGGEGGVCKGDSGGPLVLKDQARNAWDLIGVTSFGRECLLTSVFTRVSYHVPWIQQTLNQNL